MRIYIAPTTWALLAFPETVHMPESQPAVTLKLQKAWKDPIVYKCDRRSKKQGSDRHWNSYT